MKVKKQMLHYNQKHTQQEETSISNIKNAL